MNDEPPYQIEIIDRQSRCKIDAQLLQRCVSETLLRFQPEQANLNIAVVSDQDMTRLHEEFRGLAGPTDVLAFDLREAHTEAGALEGDVVVSADTAARVAKQRGHSFDAELALYVVHGTLHLLGLDDHDARGAENMQRLQNEVLSAVGVGPVAGD